MDEKIYKGWKAFRKLPNETLGGYHIQKNKERPIGCWINEVDYRHETRYLSPGFFVFLDKQEADSWMETNQGLILKEVEAKNIRKNESDYWKSLFGFEQIKIL